MSGSSFGKDKEEEDEDDDYNHRRDEDEDDDETLQSKRLKSIDNFALEEDDDVFDAAGRQNTEFATPAPPRPRFASLGSSQNQLAPFQANMPNRNPNAVRPEYATIDSVSYYNETALWTLLYLKMTQGIAIPAVFDEHKQKMLVGAVLGRYSSHLICQGCPTN